MKKEKENIGIIGPKENDKEVVGYSDFIIFPQFGFSSY